ncbi:MAG: fructokinase [Chlamydiae bacterium RIFCSPHIGHO2_12_FULL_27_8]|nr:MAG: fructokinase [Chlamydiae bacterium RIFCSPHIGHO2_12_FULL_27_8]
MDGKILNRIQIPTKTPEVTIPKIIEFFQKESINNNLKAIGIGTFGPADVDPSLKTFGMIRSTPKQGWKDFDFISSIKKHFNIPIGFDTDVNSSALGENNWGAAKGIDTFVYITVGTGIGVGAVVEKNLLHGLTHPEMGHIFIPQNKEDDFEGVCPYHKNCLEGLASGPSMSKRWKLKEALDLAQNHIGWEFESDYLSLAIANYILCLSPKIIILGGGVMNQNFLLPIIHKKVKKLLNGYINNDMILKNIDKFIVKPALGNDSGIFGALALALEAEKKKN